jgi:hypothetical protein
MLKHSVTSDSYGYHSLGGMVPKLVILRGKGREGKGDLCAFASGK